MLPVETSGVYPNTATLHGDSVRWIFLRIVGQSGTGMLRNGCVADIRE